MPSCELCLDVAAWPQVSFLKALKIRLFRGLVRGGASEYKLGGTICSDFPRSQRSAFGGCMCSYPGAQYGGFNRCRCRRNRPDRTEKAQPLAPAVRTPHTSLDYPMIIERNT